jgi:hypothetical protein
MTTDIPIGAEDCMVQLSSLSAEEEAEINGEIPEGDAPPARTTLLTVRAGKDTDLTEQQLRALAAALLAHADYIAQVAP